jgi:hypothetical protein
MAWVWLTLLGLAVETAVIIVLGRQVTAGWESGAAPAPGVTGSSPAATEVDGRLAGTAPQFAAGTGRADRRPGPMPRLTRRRWASVRRPSAPV